MFFNSSYQKDLQIGGYVNRHYDVYGMDCYESCLDKSLFRSFPHQVSYAFNELGYRERPITEYDQKSIICIGDSFTVGLGLPVELTYPHQLQKILNYPVLNFSMNGASNDWISRKIKLIIKYFSPPVIIVHYTFSHRRESENNDWFDNERTLCDANVSVTAEQEDYENWVACYTAMESLGIPVVHSFIPSWHVPPTVPNNCVPPCQVDYARDGFHYGEHTCQLLAENLALKISKTGAPLPY